MGKTSVVFFKDEDGTAMVYEGLQALLREGKRKAFAKLQVRIARLGGEGFELRRPEAAYLRDEVHELRARHRRIHYRILYFFHGRTTAVLSHLITKEGKVPEREIDLAVRHKQLFEADPERHTFRV